MKLEGILNEGRARSFSPTKIGSIILLVLLIAGLLSGTSTTFGEEEVPPDKVIKFTGDANWVPYQFLNEFGEPDGFSVDLVHALCQELNLRCEIELYQDWPQAQKDVADGFADAVVGLGKTPERENIFDFSVAIAKLNGVIAVRKETATIYTLENLYGTSIAIVGGTPYHSQLSQDARFNVIPVRGEADGLKKLANREVMAFISSELAIRHTVQYYQIEGIKIVGRPVWEIDYAIGAKKGNKQLLEIINLGLSSLEEKGTVDELITKWFGLEIRVRELPSWVRWVAGTGVSITILIGIYSLILLVFNKRLTEKVKDRTAALQQANEELKKEIHERKRAEEELREHREHLEELVEERTAELEAFTYSVSHDLRAPLRAMEGFSQALLEDYADRLDPVGQDYAHRIAAAAQHMDILIQDLLTYSRLSRVEIKLRPVVLEGVVQEALSLLTTEIQEKSAQVTVERPLPRLVGHHATLVQVVGNLLSNAIKFVAPGVKPQVRVWAEERAEWVRLWVEDNGIGIAPEHHELIFRIFERLYGVETYSGTGVGLAIVRKGVERLGGRVGVESEPGRGSRFWVELPRSKT